MTGICQRVCFPTLGLVAVLIVAQACGGASSIGSRRDGRESREPKGSLVLKGATGETNTPDRRICQVDPDVHQVAEYDTNGDDYEDVRRVFRRLGDGVTGRLVLVCRDTDLNGDGVKDVVRDYTKEGRPRREESDRDFDGRMDQIMFFELGRIARLEQDTVGDGKVDFKMYYDSGKPIRTERDTRGESTPGDWKPDRWEYFENGRMIRVGMDVDGDGTVDRWDRDEIYKRQQDNQGS